MASERRWLLLRGLAREGAHWGDFPDRFARELGVEAARLDLPGAGSRRGERCPLSLGEIVDKMRSGDGPPWDGILALSLGAMVAMEWITRYPEDFRRAVFLNTSLAGYSAFHRRLTPEAVLGGLGYLLHPDPVFRERRILELTSNRPDVRERTLPSWAEIARARPVSRENVLRQVWAAARSRVEPSRIPIPVLLLASRGDRLAHVSCSESLSARFGWELRVHPDAGHDLALDDPQWCLRAVTDWLSKTS